MTLKSLYSPLVLIGMLSGASQLVGINACQTTDADEDGWSSQEGDCDDSNPSIYPGAHESCDFFDNDCDGLVDEDLVCEGCTKQTYNEHDYLFCPSPESWDHALENCYLEGRSLVTINDANEDSWLMSTAVGIVGSGYGWWSGLTDHEHEGTFVWANGEAVSYTNWDSGEPNNSGDEDCTTFIHLDAGSYHWNDLPCSIEIPYVCE